jgi:hypothetical protein
VHQLHNPSAEEIEAPKDQTLVEVKPQGFDPRWEIRIKLGNFTTLNPVFNQRLGQRSPENSGICGMFFSEETIRMLFATDCLCGLVHIDCTGFFMGQWSAINMSPQK